MAKRNWGSYKGRAMALAHHADGRPAGNLAVDPNSVIKANQLSDEGPDGERHMIQVMFVKAMDLPREMLEVLGMPANATQVRISSDDPALADVATVDQGYLSPGLAR